MAESHIKDIKQPLLDAQELAIDRTRFAADRTLLAWIRTSLSLTTFGFSVFKFFQYLHHSGLASTQFRPEAPRIFGTILMGLGTALSIIAMVQYFSFMKELNRGARQVKTPFTTTFIAALLIALLGILGLVNVAFRVGGF